MATPVWCCGVECAAAGPHWTVGNGTFITSSKRTGSYALSCASGQSESATIPSGNVFVVRVYVYISTTPGAGTSNLLTIDPTSHSAGALLDNTSGTYAIYAGVDTTKGTTGVVVTTGAWYRIDMKVDIHANPWARRRLLISARRPFRYCAARARARRYPLRRCKQT